MVIKMDSQYNQPQKLLKLNKPMIYCYTILGTLFSIIEDKDMPWIYSNFTQIMYHEGWKMFIFEDQKNILDKCPFIQTEFNVLKKKKKKEHPFIDIIIHTISEGNYIFLFLDWKYIFPNSTKNSFSHSTLISGYDKNKKIFYLSDNYNNGKFTTLEIDMKTVEKAFYSAWNEAVKNIKEYDDLANCIFLKTIIAFKRNEKVYIEFDRKGFIIQLKSFINSETTYVFGEKDKKLYGYSSYNWIIDDLLKGRLEFGLKNYHFLYEHKYLMHKRLEYMVNNNIISSSHNYIERSNELSNDFLIIRNLYIKSQLVDKSKKGNIILDICEKIRSSKEKEKLMYEELIAELDRDV